MRKLVEDEEGNRRVKGKDVTEWGQDERISFSLVLVYFID
jgi:hypothetical protein